MRDSNQRPSGSVIDAVSTVPTHSDGLGWIVKCIVMYLTSATPIMNTKIHWGHRIRKRG